MNPPVEFGVVFSSEDGFARMPEPYPKGLAFLAVPGGAFDSAELRMKLHRIASGKVAIVPRELVAYEIAALLPDTDLFLYDLKETDPEKHMKYTRVPLAPVLENLARIDAAGGEVILRCPLIPGLNDRDGHADGIAEIANRLTHLREINLMPYHPLGESKLARLGREPGLGGEFASQGELEPFRRRIEKACRVPVSFS